MHVGVLVVALGLAVGAVSPAPNVRGTVVAPAPLRSACPPGEPCDPHQVGAFVVFTRGTLTVARARVVRGAFALHLPAGRYGVRLAPPPLGGRVAPAFIVVPRTGSVALRLTVKRATAVTG